VTERETSNREPNEIYVEVVEFGWERVAVDGGGKRNGKFDGDEGRKTSVVGSKRVCEDSTDDEHDARRNSIGVSRSTSREVSDSISSERKR
jgi:hypothetical protein